MEELNAMPGTARFDGLQKLTELRLSAEMAMANDKRAANRFYNKLSPKLALELFDEMDLLYKMLSEKCVEVVNKSRETDELKNNIYRLKVCGNCKKWMQTFDCCSMNNRSVLRRYTCEKWEEET